MDLIGKPVKETEESVDMFDSQMTVDNTNSFLLKIGGKEVNRRMEKLGNTVDEIKKFQLIRLIKSIIALLAPLMLYVALDGVTPIAIGIVLAVVMWFFDYLRVYRVFTEHEFRRELDFNKLMRMLMPYLRANGITLYAALNRMKSRLEEGTTRTALVGLIAQLNQKTDDRNPYETFADKASGKEESKLIMQTLYDYNQSSKDSSTINELAKMIDKEIEGNIDEIIDKKDFSFEVENYALGASIMFVFFGYFTALAISNISQFWG